MHFSRPGRCEFEGQRGISSSAPRHSSPLGRFPAKPGPRRHLPEAAALVCEYASEAAMGRRLSGQQKPPLCRSFHPPRRRRTFCEAVSGDSFTARLTCQRKENDVIELHCNSALRTGQSLTAAVKTPQCWLLGFMRTMDCGTRCSNVMHFIGKVPLKTIFPIMQPCTTPLF